MNVLVYVNDILIIGSNAKEVQQIIDKLYFNFALKDLGLLNYFLGFEITRNSSGIHFSKHKYIKSLLTQTSWSDAKSCDTPMSSGK